MEILRDPKGVTKVTAITFVVMAILSAVWPAWLSTLATALPAVFLARALVANKGLDNVPLGRSLVAMVVVLGVTLTASLVIVPISLLAWWIFNQIIALAALAVIYVKEV